MGSQPSRAAANRTNSRRYVAAAQRFLAEASELVFGSLDYETTLVSLARLSVPFLADWCMVDVLEDDGSLRRIAEAHVDPTRTPLLRRLEQEYPPVRGEQRGIAGVLRTGKTIYNADVSDDILTAVAKDAAHLDLLTALGFTSHISVPLTARGRALGVISFVRGGSAPRHTPADVSLAEELAMRAAVAVDNARLFRVEQAATRRFQDLVQNLEAVVWEKDLVADRLTFVSNRTEQILGYPVETVYAHPEVWGTCIQPDDREWVTQAYRDALTAGGAHAIEYRIQTLNGPCIWVRDQINVQTDRDGRPTKMLGITLDVTERKAAATARDAGEARFRALVQNSSDMIFVVERTTGLMQYVSPSVARMLGRQADDIGGSRWREWLHPDDLPSVSTIFRNALPGSSTIGPFESRLRHHDGSWRHIESVATDIADEAGISGWVINSRDITERKQVEAVLSDSEQWWRALTQNATDVTVLLNAHAEIQWVSAPAERILGYEPEDMLGVNAFEIIHPDDQAQCLASFGEVLQTPGTHAPLELRIRHADGSWRWFETRANNLLYEPIVGAIVQNLRDITPRKEREEERALLAAIVETSEDAIVGKTLDGRITSWNSGAERIYGYTAGEAVGESITILALPEQHEEVSEILDRLRAGESISHFETRRRRKDGAVIDVSLAASPVRDAAGNVIAASAIARDITGQKRFAARLAQAERLSSVGELAAGVAHEVNNPLAAISLTAELALRQQLSPGLHNDLTLIRHEAGRAGDIVRALLRFARHREPALEPIQLGEIIEEALLLLADRLSRHRIELIRDMAPAPDTLGDRDQLLQVLINLLTNAVDAMKHDGCGQLRVRLACIEDQVELSLTDSGNGIPEDTVARIFDPFFTTKAPGEGTGLGLSISHRIIADHNGALTATNAADGGACFRITLPIMQRAMSPNPEAATGARVVILHRDRLAAEMHAEAVRLLGYEPTIPCDELQEWSSMLDTGVMAVMVGPDAEGEVSRHGGALPRPRLILIAATPERGTDIEWDAILPDRYRLDDLKRALEGMQA